VLFLSSVQACTAGIGFFSLSFFPIPVILSFRFCTVEILPHEQTVITRFPDGAMAFACPHDTPEYHAHAIEKTGKDDIFLYCFQHDLMHSLHGEMHNRPSVVLWALAHDLPTNTAECEMEEEQAQTLQRNLQMRP
jgi:hypothetical protein